MIRHEGVSVVRRRFWACLVAVSCAACAHQGVPPVVVKSASIPVVVRCPAGVSPAPAYPDTEQALAGAADVFAGVQLLLAGRLLRIAREAELEAAVRACAN